MLMTLTVNSLEEYQYQGGWGTSLKTASEFMKYIPVRR
jgi:hypothetical protein